jgi:hypothetical protein
LTPHFPLMKICYRYATVSSRITTGDGGCGLLRDTLH